MSDPSSSAPIRRIATELGVALAYLLLAVAFTWPCARDAAWGLPTGVSPSSVPASAGTWALWWVSESATRGFVGFWDAPIFFPSREAFALSETSLPLGLAAAPLFWLGLSPGVIYATVVLACLVGNGLAARWVAKLLGAREIAAFVVGAWLVASPLTSKWLAVMPLVPLFPILLFVGSCLQAARNPGWRWGVAVGASMALTWLICLQYGYFLLLCAPVFLFLAKAERRHLVAVGVAGLVAVALLAPILVPQARSLAQQGMERRVEYAEWGGASLRGMWLRAPVPPRIGIPAPISGLDANDFHQGIYPGTVLLLLVLASTWTRRRDREYLALLAAIALSFAWSILPKSDFGEISIFDLLYEWLPGLDKIRKPRRAAAVAMALFPVVAAPALNAFRGRWTWMPVWILGMALHNEWPHRMRMQRLPERDPAWMALIEEQVGDGVVTFLPAEELFKDPRRGSTGADVERMIQQTVHGRRMTNGYSSYYPASYRELNALMTPAPQPQLWTELARIGVTHVACPEGWLPPEATLTEVGRAGGQVLYRL